LNAHLDFIEILNENTHYLKPVCTLIILGYLKKQNPTLRNNKSVGKALSVPAMMLNNPQIAI